MILVTYLSIGAVFAALYLARAGVDFTRTEVTVLTAQGRRRTTSRGIGETCAALAVWWLAWPPMLALAAALSVAGAVSARRYRRAVEAGEAWSPGRDT